MIGKNGKGFIFGPVPSRRLGRSLGIDLLPCKMCPFDCIYCECGPTEYLTLERFSEPSPDIIMSQLKDFVSAFPVNFDVITFSGTGEPTLYQPIGDLIEMIKKSYPSYPVAVLTNGSLLKDPLVRGSLLKADIVSPSLDASNEILFRKINRPHPDLSFDELLEGLKSFREEYEGNYRLEVLLLKGINDDHDNLVGLSEIVREIKPDVVDLTTLARPGTVSELRGLSTGELQKCAKFFYGILCSVVGDYSKKESACKKTLSEKILDNRIVELLSRRPCALEDLADSLGILLEDAKASVERIGKNYRLKLREVGGKIYYFLGSSPS